MTRAAQAVAGMAAAAPGISLADVLERAELQVRTDRKYLVAPAALRRLGGELDVLDIGGRRSFDYESRYFDTPGLQTYHEHAGGRPDRFKVRTRSYLDSAETMFEVKLAGADGSTAKRRAPHAFDARDRVTAGAWRHLSATLEAAGRRLPSTLVGACTIAYRRTTFVARDGSARITCDHDLVCTHGAGAVRALADHVLVEVKSPGGPSRIDRALAGPGVEPVSMSKYCVGLALLHPELPSGPWDALLPALAAA